MASRRRGAALLLTLLMMIMLCGLALAVGVSAHNSLLTGRMALQDKQAYYIAEAGLQRARQALSAGTWAAASGSGNSYTESFGAGVYVVTIVDNAATTTVSGSTDYTITSEAYIPSQSNYQARRQVHEYEADVDVSTTNYSLTATASASSADGSHPASNAKDGDTSTKWKAGSNDDAWLQMDYGSAVSLDLLVTREDSNIDGIASVQYSDDGSAWTSVAGLTVTEPSSKVWHADFTAASHRYFRVTYTIGSSKKGQVKELQSYGGSGSVTFSDDGEVTTEW
jgi:Tfp pilus assembly protein PilX